MHMNEDWKKRVKCKLNGDRRRKESEEENHLLVSEKPLEGASERASERSSFTLFFLRFLLAHVWLTEERKRREEKKREEKRVNPWP